jgi:hypothetical protein
MSIHTCSYYCDRPECIRAQRDELRQKLEQAEDVVAAERKECAQLLVDKAKDMSLYLDLPCAIERDEDGKAIDGKPTRQERINTLLVASKLILARNQNCSAINNS